jgi:hypothetical protein
MKRCLLRSAVVALLLVPSVFAQTLKEVVPAAFAPGDIVSVRGSNLDLLTQVSFKAIVGGFLGVHTINQPVLTATPDEVLVAAPLFNSFAPPFAGSTPFGTLGGSLPVYFMEGTFGQTTTAGKGSPSPTFPLDKVVVDFVLANGGPQPNNASFTLKMENGPSVGAAFVIAGRPAGMPVPFAGGVLAVDLNVPFVLLGPFPVDAQGTALAPLPLPAPLGATIALQWFTHGAGSNQKLISNGLVVEL